MQQYWRGQFLFFPEAKTGQGMKNEAESLDISDFPDLPGHKAPGI